MIAMGGFVALIGVRRMQARRKRLALDIRPPDCGRLLRPPGHWLQEQLLELTEKENDLLVNTLGFALGAGTVAALSLSLLGTVLGQPGLLRHPEMQWLIVAVFFGLALAALCGVQSHQGMSAWFGLRLEMENKRLGLRGEQAVAEVLHSREVTRAGYFAFHDVPADRGGNIDHVVIGPGGVFVIETKARSQRRPPKGYKRNRLHFDGNKAVFPAGQWDDRVATQAANNARQVERWLAEAGIQLTVMPLVLFPGWEVHMTERSEVKALSPRSLQFFLIDLPPRWSEAELSVACSALDRRARTVEM